MRTLAASLALLALLAAAPAASAGERFRRCGNIGFTPQSDDAAADIRARGVGCRFARGFVRDSEGAPGRRFRGYRCGRRSVDPPDGLAHTRYSCRRGQRIIRWLRF